MLKKIIFVIVSFIYVLPAFAETQEIQETQKVYIGSSLMTTNKGGYEDDAFSTFEINGGYSLNKHFAIELNYIDLGGSEISESHDIDTSGIALTAVAKYPINNFTFYGEVGNYWWKQEGIMHMWWVTPYREEKTKESSASIIWGTGVSYNVFDSLAFKFEIKNTDINSKSKVLVSIGADYYF